MPLIRQLLAILLCLNLFLSGCDRKQIVANTNQLALGSSAKVKDPIAISLKKSIDLNGTSSVQIADVRRQVLEAYSAMLLTPYKTWPPLVERINADSQWVSLVGLQYDGMASMCGSGESYESMTLINPFILISPHFTRLSRVSNDFEWDPSKVSRSQALAPDFPLFPKPSLLIWNAKDQRAILSFNLADFLDRANPYLKTPISSSGIDFHIIGYNALDFNLGYLAYSMKDTSNITFENQSSGIIPIRDVLISRQIIKDGPYCNAASYPRKEMYGLKISSLPAKLGILLWKAAPSSSNATPDMVFSIEFN